MVASKLVRETRARHGLSQRSLARRAGTSQSWISDVERGRVSPSEESLRRLMLCLGEELVMSTRRMVGHRDHGAPPPAADASMADRIIEGASWAELASAMAPEA